MKKYIVSLLGLVMFTVSQISQAQTVASFNPANAETPENVYIDLIGNRYVTLSLTGEVRKISPSGLQSSFAQMPLDGAPLTPCNTNLAIPFPAVSGIDQDWLGNFYFAVKSCTPSKTGIWRTNSHGGNLTQVTTLPTSSLPGGITIWGGHVYVTDMVQPNIWRASIVGGPATVWLTNSLFAVNSSSMRPGLNGIKFFRGEIYVSNSSTNLILATMINLNGTAGQVRTHANTSVEGGCDDFAFDILGNLYCGTDPFQKVLKVTQTGQVSVLLSSANGLDGPTSVFFGRGNESTYIYITNASYPFYGSPTQYPSLIKYNVGVLGSIIR